MGNVNINLRPMNNGMITNAPPNLIPSGAFLDLNGFIVKDGNLRLRPRFTGAQEYDYSSQYDDAGKTIDQLIFPADVSTMTSFTITEKRILLDTGSAYSAVSVDRGAGATTDILNYNNLTGTQWTLGRDADGPAVWVSDGSQDLLVYNGSSPSWSQAVIDDQDGTPRTDLDACRTVLYHDNRLWIGGPDSTTGMALRWSDLNQPDVFHDASYMDFANRSQPILKLLSLGDYLIVYFPDAIYIGQPSGDPYLPYTFIAVESESLGLLGPRAISRWKNGHIFIAKHGIFWLRPDLRIEEVPCPIWGQLKEEITNTDLYNIVTSGEHEDVYIGYPGSGYNCGRIFHYNSYEGNAWSYWDTEGDCLTISKPIATLVWSTSTGYPATAETTLPDGTEIETWDDGGSTDWEAAGVESWADLGRFTNPLTVTMWKDGKLYAMSEEHTKDEFSDVGTAFAIETGDYDFDQSDMMKTFHRTRIRHNHNANINPSDIESHNIQVHGSIDGGRTWKNLGIITINSEDEAQLNFRLTGAEIRLKFSGNAQVLPYRWDDVTFRIRGRGLETS